MLLVMTNNIAKKIYNFLVIIYFFYFLNAQVGH